MTEKSISVEEFEESIDKDELVAALTGFGLVVPNLTNDEFIDLISDEDINELFNNVYDVHDKEDNNMEHEKYMPSKREYIQEQFERRNIYIADMAELVYDSQKKHIDGLEYADAVRAVEAVMKKREVRHALLVALALDNLAMYHQLPEPLQTIVAEDQPLFGVDEDIAVATSGLNGSIATTNYGNLDVTKPGIIGRLNDDQKEGKMITTFLDDMISAISAQAMGRLAHKYRYGITKENKLDSDDI